MCSTDGDDGTALLYLWRAVNLFLVSPIRLDDLLRAGESLNSNE